MLSACRVQDQFGMQGLGGTAAGVLARWVEAPGCVIFRTRGIHGEGAGGTRFSTKRTRYPLPGGYRFSQYDAPA